MTSDSHTQQEPPHSLSAPDGTVAYYSSAENNYALDSERYESTGLPTSASGAPLSYPPTLLRHHDVLAQVMLGLCSVQDDRVRRMTSQLLSTFQRILTLRRNATDAYAYLPPLTFHLLDDGSALIEWIFKDFRIGFSIEKEDAESGWYLVSNENLREVSKSGVLDPQDMDSLVSDLLSFVVSNT